MSASAISGIDTAAAMFHLRRQESGNDFLRLHLQRVVAISAVYRSQDKIAVWSLGDEKSDEKALIEKFFHLIGISNSKPTGRGSPACPPAS